MTKIQLEDLAPLSRALLANSTFRDVISRQIEKSTPNAKSGVLNLEIHPNDQMLEYSLLHLKSAGAALSQYFGVALQQHKAADQIISVLYPQRSAIKVLDFACGYGRMLRFLAQSVRPDQIWASDIQSDAVDFVVTSFGVNGIYSDVDPAKFQPDRKFDFIWVASLFSHLPGPLFDEWLAKLGSVLSPQGVICFSVHDEVLLPAGQRMADKGIVFASESENAELAKDAYGTTHVSESYVRGAIERAFGKAHPYRRLKRGLAYQQDLYVVSKDAARDLTVLDAFRWGPWGWVDVRSIRENGDLNLSGWATSFDHGGIDSVSVSYDGNRVDCKVNVVRADVEGVFQDARLRQSGWETVCKLRPGTQESLVEILAHGTNGDSALLYAGAISEPLVASKPLAPLSLSSKIKRLLFNVLGKS